MKRMTRSPLAAFATKENTRSKLSKPTVPSMSGASADNAESPSMASCSRSSRSRETNDTVLHSAESMKRLMMEVFPTRRLP